MFSSVKIRMEAAPGLHVHRQNIGGVQHGGPDMLWLEVRVFR
jgi:hypothetical protein